MIRKSRPRRVVTVFRSYFKPQRLNGMVKNLFVHLPTIGIGLKNAKLGLTKLYEPLMAILFKENRHYQKRIDAFDLSMLNDTLALGLRNAARAVRIPDSTSLKYEELNLGEILKKQGELLRDSIAEQQKALRQQSEQIIEEEKDRIKNRHQRKSRMRARK
jgi:hypothetical protein